MNDEQVEPTEREHVARARAVESDRTTLAQRRINAVWEYTQAAVALIVVLTTSAGMFIGRVVVGDNVPFPAEWWTIVGLVIGFYFGRTNHTRAGGIDAVPPVRNGSSDNINGSQRQR